MEGKGVARVLPSESLSSRHVASVPHKPLSPLLSPSCRIPSVGYGLVVFAFRSDQRSSAPITVISSGEFSGHTSPSCLSETPTARRRHDQIISKIPEDTCLSVGYLWWFH